MANLMTALVIVAGMMATLTLMGLQTNTSQLLDAFSYNNLSESLSGDFMLALFAILAAIGSIGGVFAGFILGQDRLDAMLSGLVGGITTWVIGDLISVWSALGNFDPAFDPIVEPFRILMILMTIIVTVVIVSWMRGAD